MNDSVLLGPDSLSDPKRLHDQLDALEKKLHSEDDAASERIANQAASIEDLQNRVTELENVTVEAEEDETVIYVDLGTPGNNTLVEHNLGVLRPNWFIYTSGVPAGSAGPPSFVPVDENSGRLRYITGPATSVIMKFVKLKSES
ncbi:MAG: hypothetical protein AAGF86_12745 [Pseudomonadota bacterium]